MAIPVPTVEQCSYGVCSLPLYRRALCRPHYQRQLKGSDMDKPFRSDVKLDYSKCSELNCLSGARSGSASLCTKHYKRKYKGKPLEEYSTCVHCDRKFSISAKRTKYCEDCAPSGNAIKRTHVYRTGITWAMREAMYFDQDGQCAMPSCLNEATELDHWHGCDKGHAEDKSCVDCVRSLLCASCNVKMGIVETFGSRAFEYLKEWSPA